MNNAEKIMIIGAGGQIGVELTLALRKAYGADAILATDIKPQPQLLKGKAAFVQLDVLDKEALFHLADEWQATQIYLMAAVLSATGEQNPELAWHLNMQSLLHVLELARQRHTIKKIFWPSSIAVFGPTSPKEHCPEHTIIEPQTVYGISKYAGELWCNYYHDKYGVDVRSLRYPGLISSKVPPGGGTTDYAVAIFHEAVKHNRYTCFLHENTRLPMMHMPDAIRATLELMDAPASSIRNRMSYNVAGISFTPAELAEAIRQHLPSFKIDYAPDYRQQIADSWPSSIDDREARADWGWQPHYALEHMVEEMIVSLKEVVL